ncbi:hypothetical protein [Parapedobacter tibetensis]|uniref:hypothetical protein n=1 Tax=Parapedobacter tibetensis TaxID=2972951 RepID=UPI00214DEDFB|nr:hypothetical protein [Parapedobacter tibetensis]
MFFSTILYPELTFTSFCEAKGNRLLISFTYGLLQVVIGLLVIQIAQWDTSLQWVYALVILGGLALVYVVMKMYLLKRYVGYPQPIYFEPVMAQVTFHLT